MRKYFLPLLAILLILGGCGVPAESDVSSDMPSTEKAASSLPELSPLAELSAPAVVTEGREPTDHDRLPDQLWQNPIADDDFPLLVAELPEANAAFYGLQWDTALIRWGDCQAEFDWPWLTPHQILPRLFCLDFDDDHEDELVVICHTGSGTGVAYQELHVLEKSPEGTLTDYALPWELFSEELTSALSVATVNNRTYSILGTQLVDITANLPEDADPADIEGLRAGDIVYFEATPDSPFWGNHFRYQGSACLTGEPFPRTSCYVTNLDACVLYKDGRFTLSDIHLS